MERNGILALPGGRQVGYADCGASQGKPLFLFGGWPSSRLIVALYHTRMEKIGIRLIGIDRPGIGLSDPQPQRTLLDFPKDIQCLLDKLGLTKVAVIGNSSGSPYAFACTYQIPERLAGCAIVSGAPPASLLKNGNMGGYIDLLTTLGKKSPWLLKATIWWTLGRFCKTETGAKNVAEWIVKNSPKADQQAVEQHGHFEAFVQQLHESFRNGVAGPAQDWQVISGDWGFGLDEINYEPILLCHGELDTNIPIGNAREVARHIRGCKEKYYPEEGHGSAMDNHIEEIAMIMTEG